MILTTLAAVLVLLFLIAGLKWHPFLALILVAVGAGLTLGMGVDGTMKSITAGVGGTLSGLALILGLGATLGGVIAETGTARVITDRLVGGTNGTAVLWGLCGVGFLIGIPLFYTVAFVLMAPIIILAARRAGLPLAMVAVAGVASLSVTHGFLPPHPAPVMIANQFGADLGRVLLYGILLALPAVIFAGPLFARTLRNMPPGEDTVVNTAEDESAPSAMKDVPEAEASAKQPGFLSSVICALLPVFLLALGTLLEVVFPQTQSSATTVTTIETTWSGQLLFLFTDATLSLLVGVFVAMYVLGRQTGRPVRNLMRGVGKQLEPMAAVLLIIAGGGAFKQVLVDSGTSDEIVALLSSWNAHPILIAWSVAAALRVTLGSATVAAVTGAGIVLPLIESGAASPELLVLAVGAGSLTCSHVNDTGFWLFKEYFGLTVGQTLRSWTVMETLVSVVGLVGCLVLEAIGL